MSDSLRSKAISDAIDAGEQYGLNQTDAAALLARVDSEFYLRGEENGGLVIDGYNYYDCAIEDANQTEALFEAVAQGKSKQECLDALSQEADWTVESFISGRMHTIVNNWMQGKGYDLTKEENWELQDKAFEFLNDSIAIDFDRSYEQQMMRVNAIVSTTGEITVGSEDNANKRRVQSFIQTLVEDQGHTMAELNKAFDEYSDAVLLPAFSDGDRLFKEQTEKFGKFIASLASEIANSNQFNIDDFVFLSKVSVEDYARLGDEDATLTFQPGVMCGMYNSHDGSGSVLEVELEKEITVPRSDIAELQIESRVEKHGYDYCVDEVYGLVGTAWNGKSEVHDLDELDKLMHQEKDAIDVQIMEHSDGYYSGTVEVDGERCAFYCKDDTFEDECGELELAAYSEPGYLTGASFETPLPELISAQYAAIAEKVNGTIDRYEHDAAIADATYYDDYPIKWDSEVER